MSSPKFIPQRVFQVIGGILFIGAITLIILWTVNESGPYGVIARVLANDQGIYDATFALALTILVTLAPVLVIIIFLRRFSKVTSLREQVTTNPLLKSIFKTSSSSSIASSTGGSNEVYPKNLRLKRLFAFIIDRALFVLLMMITVIPLIMLKEANPALNTPAIAVAIVFVLVGAFYAWARDFYKGQSLARRWLKLRVVDETTGIPIGAWRSVKREVFLHLAPLVIIELVLLFTSPDGRRLGDRWAKTRVIQE